MNYCPTEGSTLAYALEPQNSMVTVPVRSAGIAVSARDRIQNRFKLIPVRLVCPSLSKRQEKLLAEIAKYVK